MRTSLFLKIFLGFWLVCIAVLGSWMLANQYFDQLSLDDQSPTFTRQERPPRRFLLRLIYDLQTAPDSRLQAIAEAARRDFHVGIWLLDGRGSDLLGQDVPPEVGAVAQELEGPRQRAVTFENRRHLLAHTIYRRREGVLRLVVALPPPRHPLLGLLGDNPALRLLLAMLVSGLACYALSRLLTTRLRAVGRASRRLAEGDLEARIDVRRAGGDETDALARDFNAMAEQLQDRIQAQKRLLADVSHELRSPLARLRVAIALAMSAPDKRQDYLQRMEREIERLDGLIAQLLTSQRERVALDDHIDLVPLLRQLCEDASFEGAADGKRVHLATALAEAVVPSHADLLLRSFDNMLRNALRHTAGGTEVSVTLEREADDFRVLIEDRGPGVPDTELERIFDEFYRVDSARTRESGGHGLGLAIARRAIIQHGGQLYAENTGSGLRLVVLLPAT